MQAPSARAPQFPVLPPADEERCLALAADLSRLQCATDQEIYDTVAAHVAPLPVLRRTLEVWASDLRAGPLADSAADVLLVLTPELICSEVCGKLDGNVQAPPFTPRLQAMGFCPREFPIEVLWHGHLDLAWVDRWNLSSLPSRQLDVTDLQVDHASCAGLCVVVQRPPGHPVHLLTPGSLPLRGLRALASWLEAFFAFLRISICSAQVGIPVLFRVEASAEQLAPLSSWLFELADLSLEQSHSCFTPELASCSTAR